MCSEHAPDATGWLEAAGQGSLHNSPGGSTQDWDQQESWGWGPAVPGVLARAAECGQRGCVLRGGQLALGAPSSPRRAWETGEEMGV